MDFSWYGTTIFCPFYQLDGLEKSNFCSYPATVASWNYFNKYHVITETRAIVPLSSMPVSIFSISMIVKFPKFNFIPSSKKNVGTN
jgi:hypothetical protein